MSMKVHHFLFSAICILLMAGSCQKEPQVIKVESVALNTTSLTIVEGESQSLTATVSPSNADNKKVTWSSSNSSVVTVDNNGTVTAVAPGTATITAKSDDGGKTATCSVTVNAKVVAVESVSLDKTTAEITEGETLTLTATVKPDNATNKKVIWSSSNEEIATVKDGVITAIKAGEATITAKSDDGGKTATCSVTVNAKVVAVESVSLDKAKVALEVGETFTLTATVSPDDATDKTVTWTSSDESIATVEDGVVTAIKDGSATITAKAGEKTANCAITIEAEVATNPFTITSVGSTSISITKVGAPTTITLEYRKVTGWSEYTIGSSINLEDGELAQFRAEVEGNEKFSLDDSNYYKVVISGSGTVTISGNIMSLLDKTEKRTNMPSYGFCYLFKDCKNIVNASKLELPATTLNMCCYNMMFSDCTTLQEAPVLPATKLGLSCYYKMFSGCTSLQTAPELPAINLAVGCYGSMFSGCTSLVTAPELPATTLADRCYYGMFSDCTSLQEAPVLPAATLADSCYHGMFSGCTSLQTAPEISAIRFAYNSQCYEMMFFGCSKLNYVKAMFLDKPEGAYTRDWLSGVSSTGTFVKSKNATWDVTGPNGIPEGWTVQIAE